MQEERPEPVPNLITEPLEKMTRAQRQAYLEDLVCLLVMYVIAALPPKKQKGRQEFQEITDQMTVLVAQQQFREEDERY